MADLHDVCDYIIMLSENSEAPLNYGKLQRLLYYCQAWRLAFTKSPLFEGRFQAWVHGPVNRTIFDRFYPGTLYTPVDFSNVKGMGRILHITKDERSHIDEVYEKYSVFSGSQLEELSRREDPWVQARAGLHPSAPSTSVCDEGLMASYYRRRVSDPLQE